MRKKMQTNLDTRTQMIESQNNFIAIQLKLCYSNRIPLGGIRFSIDIGCVFYMKTRNIETFFAILAAALYAINIPFGKVLLSFVSPTMMAAFLYLVPVLDCFYTESSQRNMENPLQRQNCPILLA